MTIAAIVQARTGSTRLPRKAIADLSGAPVAEWVLSRVSRVQRVNAVCLATTTKPEDDMLEEIAKRLNVRCVRGSEQDVLGRFCQAADELRLDDADLVVRITADCPFIDPAIVDQVIDYHRTSGNEYTNNLVTHAFFPRGLDAEVFSAGLLRRISTEVHSAYDREHVTTFIRNNPEKFTIGFFRAAGIYRRPDLRFCIDTADDMERARRIASQLGEHITADRIIRLFPRPRLAVLCEGGGLLGTGHVRRPLKVLEYLRDMLDFEATFFMNNNPSLLSLVAGAGYRTQLFPVASTIEERRERARDIAGRGYAALIVDLYEIFQNDTQALGKSVFTIDEHYTSPSQALLSKRFDGAPKKTVTENVHTILVTFGGSDPHQLTLRALEALKQSPVHIDVIVGNDFQHITDVDGVVRAHPHVAVHKAVDDLSVLMSRADVAVCNAGTTMYELCFLGVPCIVVAQTPYEMQGGGDMERRGAVVFLGSHEKTQSADIRNSVETLMHDVEKRRTLSHAGIALVRNATPALARAIVHALIP